MQNRLRRDFWLTVPIDSRTDAVIDAIREVENARVGASSNVTRASLTRCLWNRFIEEWKARNPTEWIEIQAKISG